MARAKRRRRGSAPSLARFFTKQLLLFVALAFLIVVVDFALYTVIAYRESNENFDDGTPAVVTRAVDEALSHGDEGWALDAAGAEALDAHGAWALVVDGAGEAAWSHGLPADVPTSFSPNEVAMAAHYADIAGYPAFFWDRDDGLLVVGFPKGAFWHMGLTFPASTVRNVPFYLMLIFAVDLGILFAVYAVSRRRTQRAVGPIADALGALSEGRSAQVSLKGDLREIGEQITEASGNIEQKDAARANWIRGVSHDIRTPLSMILGYADALAADERMPQDARAEAALIRAQGLKIKDLVTDLNTASKLDYDMQPLKLDRVHLPRLLRTVVAGHVNAGLDELHPIDLEVAEDAAEAVVLADERLLTRAVENAIANARLHNEGGCEVEVSLAVRDGRALVRVADDGVGASPAKLAELEARLARARTARSAAGSYGEEHGLGLVLVDRIARAHGGALALESAPGCGFAAEIILPLA